MNYREIGKTGIKVSEISLGCLPLGGLSWKDGRSNGWAEVDEAEIQRAVDYALDQGINHFDNADGYGDGRAERLLAKILGTRSNRVVVSSKVGHFRGTAEHAYDPLHIRHQCEQSLKNLGRDTLDIYYFHHGNFGPKDVYLEDAVAEMEKLRGEGKFRILGLSAYSADDFLRLAPKIRPQVLQANASLVHDEFIRAGGPVSRLMERDQLSLVAHGVLGRGVLSGKYGLDGTARFPDGDVRREHEFFTPEALEKIGGQLEALKQRLGTSPADLSRAAIGFVLRSHQVCCGILGFRKLEQVKSNIEAALRPLSETDYRFLLELFSGDELWDQLKRRRSPEPALAGGSPV